MKPSYALAISLAVFQLAFAKPQGYLEGPYSISPRDVEPKTQEFSDADAANDATEAQTSGQAFQSYYYPSASYYSGYQQPYYQPLAEKVLYDPYAKSWFRATPVISVDDGATDAEESYLDPSTYLGVFSPSVQIYIVNPNRQPIVQPSVEAQNLGFESDNGFGVVPEPATFTAEQTTGQIDDPKVPNFETRTSEQPLVEEVIAAPKSALATSSDNFASKLFTEVASSTSADSNLVLAPFSLHSVLTMTALGTSGKASEELSGLLGIADESTLLEDYKSAQESLRVKGDFDLTTSNHIFVDDRFSVNTDYSTIVGDVFHSTPVPIKFKRKRQSAKTINDVIEKATNGKISKVFEEGSIDTSTKVILMSAIHFKGDWLYPFDESSTAKRDFHFGDGKTTKVDTMFMENHFSLTELRELDSRALKISYKDKRLSMIVILPNKIGGLGKVEASLANFDLSSIKFDPEEVMVQLSMPKFKLSSDLGLNDNLKELGVREIFDDDADFSKLTSTHRDIHVSSVVQKAVFEVNEKGSEAAAVAAVTIDVRTASFESYSFIIDHPFFFFLKDDLSGLILFTGRVANPNRS